jgi:hypothetical protein
MERERKNHSSWRKGELDGRRQTDIRRVGEVDDNQRGRSPTIFIVVW